ncbi:hypothetical protein DKE52_021375 (plasmid) [Acinetobacter pittii]|uniref:PIN domain-containing protein n=1 Tax=Acinetobacter pittii TaxID=48296 RepID=A0A3G6YM60_ACIPI|nr:hypothetical protein DKE52_021375 [Acinetobacter pittii]
MADREQDIPIERDIFLMEYLLDTNIVGYLLQGVASNKLKNKLMMVNPDSVFISQITHAEIVYGLEKGGNIPKHIDRVNSF